MTDQTSAESNLDLVNDMLTREQAIANLIAPTGNSFVIIKNPSNHMCRIEWKDKRSSLPAELEGEWTSLRLALDNVNGYLNKFWDKSDAVVAKNLKKRNASLGGAE